MRGFQPAAKAKAAKPFANGGPVRGPGSGTSDEVPDKVADGTYIMPADSTQAVGQDKLATMGADPKGVPVQLSDGEFKMPPEQVHAIGVQALDQMKGATHVPVGARGFAAGAVGAQQQPEPPLFFADGGLVDDENRRANSFGDAAAVVSTPGTTQVGAPAAAAPRAPAPSAAPSPSNTFPGNQLQDDSGTRGLPAPSVSMAAPAPAGLGVQAASPTTQPPLPAAPAATQIPKSQQISNSMLVGPAATRGEQARQTSLMNQAQNAAIDPLLRLSITDAELKTRVAEANARFKIESNQMRVQTFMANAKMTGDSVAASLNGIGAAVSNQMSTSVSGF